MVWIDNFVVNDKMFSTQRFLNVFFSFSIYDITLLIFNFPLFFSKDPSDMIKLGRHLDAKRFPKHFLFANFQCLRCGLCCKKYKGIDVLDKSAIKKWVENSREDVLKHLTVVFDDPEGFFRAEIDQEGPGCPLICKMNGKPYYGCGIHLEKDSLPICSSYICNKSIPVGNLSFADVDELIEKIGLERYKELVDKYWDNDFA